MSAALSTVTSDWTRGEIEVVRTAVQAAPSVQDTHPWILEFHGRGHGASLFERLSRTTVRHDSLGRDVLISCGAALENLVLALRVLGWIPHVDLLPDRADPDEVARIAARHRRAPSDVELARYAAIPARRSHRPPFTDVRVDPAVYATVAAASDVPGVEVRAIRGERDIAALTRLFEHAAAVLKGDRTRHSELPAWTELGGECLFVVETPDDGPRDHVRAGMAMQSAWLAATAATLAGSVLTQPLRLRAVRAGLIERLELAGFPQALMRFGHGTKEEPS